AERGGARLLVVDRARDGVRHATVAALPDLLAPGDLVVLNDTRVVPARVRGRRPTGGRGEGRGWRAGGGAAATPLVLARGAGRAGERVFFPDAEGEWVRDLGDGRWHLRLALARPLLEWLDAVGEVPLPPYIRRPAGPTAADRERYQTTFARHPGAVA